MSLELKILLSSILGNVYDGDHDDDDGDGDDDHDDIIWFDVSC